MRDPHSAALDGASLTPRERQLVELASHGYTDKEVAALLGISRDTVQTYWKRLKLKYSASSRAQLVANLFSPANEPGLVPSTPSDSPESEDSRLDELFAILDSMDDGILVEDTDGIILATNGSFRKMFGFPEEMGDMVGTKCSDALGLVVPQLKDPAKVAMNVRRAMENLQPVTAVEVELLDSRTLLQSYSPLTKGNELIGHYWHYRDATHQVSSINDASGLGTSFASIVESMPFAVICLDRSETITYVNAAGQALVQHSDRYEGRKFEHAFGSREHIGLRRAIRQTNHDQMSRWVEAPSTNEDGWFSFLISPASWGTLVCVRDVTEERKGYRSFLQYVRLGELIGEDCPRLVGAEAGEIPGLVRKIIASVGKFFGARRCTVQAIDHAGNSVEPSFEWTSRFGVEQLKLDFNVPGPQRQYWSENLNKGLPIFFPDVSDRSLDACDNMKNFREIGTQMLLILPMKWHETVIGYILVETDGKFKRDFSDARMHSALIMLADCISGAIWRARQS